MSVWDVGKVIGKGRVLLDARNVPTGGCPPPAARRPGVEARPLARRSGDTRSGIDRPPGIGRERRGWPRHADPSQVAVGTAARAGRRTGSGPPRRRVASAGLRDHRGPAARDVGQRRARSVETL